MKIGIYLGDIKKPNSMGDLTFELSFVEEFASSSKTSKSNLFSFLGAKTTFPPTTRGSFNSAVTDSNVGIKGSPSDTGDFAIAGKTAALIASDVDFEISFVEFFCSGFLTSLLPNDWE